MSFDLVRLLEEGFAITPALLCPAEITELIASIEEHGDLQSRRGGVRDVISRIPALYAVANSLAVRSIVDQVLGKDAFVVRSTLFDKTGGSNWKVPWHQDVTIAVRERIDT